MKFLLMLLLFTGCASGFSYTRCMAEAGRLGLNHDDSLKTCEIDRQEARFERMQNRNIR